MAIRKLLLVLLGISVIVLLAGLASATLTSIDLSSPADASSTNDTTPDFTFTAVSDTNTTFPCTLFVNNTDKGSNSSVLNDTSTTITSSTLSDGTYTWYINCTDLNGTNSSSSRTLTIDTSISITINTPSASSWHNSDFVINATVSNAADVAYRYENSTTNGTYTSMSNPTGNYWNATFNISTVVDGNYTIRINASSATQVNNTETVFIYIDDTNPTISSFTQTKIDTITVGEGLSASDFSCTATDNSESFGGSVSTSITGFETGTTGSHTSTCTATDSAGNTDTATVDYTVYRGAVSNGNGAAAAEPASSEIISEIKIGEVAKFTKLDSNTDIEEIRIEVNEKVTGVKLTAQKLTDKPTNVEKDAPDAVYRYLKITVTKVNETNLKSAVIKFRVEKDWLVNNSVNKGSIAMYRWSADDNWDKLSTKLVSEDDIYVYYEANTPAFSYFAVTGKAAVVPTPAEGEAEAEAEAEVEVAPPEEKKPVGAYVAVILIILIGLAAYYVVFRRPPEAKPSKLKGKYVKIKMPKKK